MPATELPQREQQILKEECEGHYETRKKRDLLRQVSQER